MKRNTTKALTEGAIMVALALVLNLLKDVIPLGQLPNGGSLLNVTMVPIVFYGIRWGIGWGTMVGFIFGGLNYVIGNGIAIDWTTILCDYFLAFAMLGLGAGLFKGKKHAVYFGSLVGGGLQFLASYLVGVFVWGRWMPDSCNSSKANSIPSTSQTAENGTSVLLRRITSCSFPGIQPGWNFMSAI